MPTKIGTPNKAPLVTILVETEKRRNPANSISPQTPEKDFILLLFSLIKTNHLSCHKGNKN